MKDIFSDRRFLNKGTYHSTSAVCATMTKEDSEHWEPLAISFSISDCSRSIYLDMDSSTIKDLENSVYKLQQIEDVARGLKESIQESRPILMKYLVAQDLKKREELLKKEEDAKQD
jgi:hypothetical protein